MFLRLRWDRGVGFLYHFPMVVVPVRYRYLFGLFEVFKGFPYHFLALVALLNRLLLLLDLDIWAVRGEASRAGWHVDNRRDGGWALGCRGKRGWRCRIVGRL